ncbi:MAG: hypothetical protein JWO54_90 [Candidatus Saccharibacteria bacterium]|nr:hypothetical protein [Candidatus Saccharibacteria bacterium]
MTTATARAFFKKTTLFATAFILAVSTLTAVVPFILSEEASAVSANVYEGIPSPQAANYTSVGYAATSTAELGDLVELAGSNRLLNDVTVNFSSWACETGTWNAGDCVSAEGATFTHPVTVNIYKVGANQTVGDLLASTTKTITAKYRPSASATCTNGKWLDTASGTCNNGIAFNQTFNFSSQTKVLPNQVIVSVAYNTSNAGENPIGATGPYDSLNVSIPDAAPTAGTDVNPDVVFWNTADGSSYTGGGVGGTFRADSGWAPYHLGVNVSAEPTPTTAACTTTTPVWSKDLTGWDTSKSRTQSTTTVTGDGLELKTFGPAGSPDQRKAAGYYSVNYPLSGVGSQTIDEALDYQIVSGTNEPGLQIVVDLDNNGSNDGILVGEKVYGNTWWLADSAAGSIGQTNAPNNGGGYGSPWYGTINEWLSKFPTAQVKQIGYSLGSGVTAEGIIKSINLGCASYKFDNVAPGLATHIAPSQNATINTNDFWFDWSDVAGAARYEIQNSTDSTVDPTTGSFQNVMWTGDYQQIQPTESTAHSVGANGTWYWQVRAIDAAGNAGAWTTPWGVTIDTAAPDAPTLVTADWYIANGATKTLKWNAVAATDVAYYEYAEYNFTAPTSDTTTPSWTKNVNAPTTSTTDTAWGSDVKIFWRVRAVDTAGNQGPWSETRTIITDRTKPTVTIDSVVLSADKKLNVSVTGKDNLSGVSTIGFNLYNSSNTTKVADLKTVNYTTHNLTETSVLNDFDTSSLASGTYVVRAASRDSAGTLSSYALQTITIDNTRPSATLNFPLVGPGATSFEVQFSEAVNQSEASNPANYFLTNWVGAGGSGDLAGDATVNYDAVTHKAVVTFTDLGWYVSPEQLWGVQNVHDTAGNLLNPNPKSAYSTPNVAPGNPGTPTTTSPATSRTTTWTWTAATDPNGSNGSGIKGYEYAFVSSNTAPTSWVATTDTSVTTNAPTDETFRLYVRAVDNAGNKSGEVYGEKSIDTTGPAVTTNSRTYTSSRPTLSGTVGSDAQTVSVVIKDEDGVQVESGDATIDGTTWSYDVVNALVNGSYTVVATATDNLDNASQSNTATIDVEVASATPETTPLTTQTPVPVENPTTDDTQAGTTILPTAVNPTTFAEILGDTTDNATDTDNGAGVEGASTENNVAQAANSEANQGSFMGMGWYWWLLIIAGIAAIAWWIAAARKRNAEN